MGSTYSVQQTILGLSDCERLCSRPSGEIQELAYRAGGGSPLGQVSVSVGTALNMMILSIGRGHGVEWATMGAWLPGLRNEALLTLGQDTSSWSFHGTPEEAKGFWSLLYGNRDAVHCRIDRLLRCSSVGTTRQLRFYSGSDVEHISNARVELGGNFRTPQFTIDAHSLADCMKAVCPGTLFTAEAAS